MQINDAYQADHDSRLMYSRNISESLAPYDCISEPRFSKKLQDIASLCSVTHAS